MLTKASWPGVASFLGPAPERLLAGVSRRSRLKDCECFWGEVRGRVSHAGPVVGGEVCFLDPQVWYEFADGVLLITVFFALGVLVTALLEQWLPVRYPLGVGKALLVAVSVVAAGAFFRFVLVPCLLPR